jgi:hypothetical protein
MQTITLPNIEIYEDAISFNPKINHTPRGVYAEEYSIVFEDFNFDGMEDLAICNGRNGGYGGPSYTVYLFDENQKRFVRNRRLSKLTEGVYYGLFQVDSSKKRLTAFWKSGCCSHQYWSNGSLKRSWLQRANRTLRLKKQPAA